MSFHQSQCAILMLSVNAIVFLNAQYDNTKKDKMKVYLSVSKNKMSCSKSKKIQIEWTEAFIREFEAEECLWNVLLQSYRVRDERQKALKNIAYKMDMSGKFCCFCIFLRSKHWLNPIVHGGG